MSRAARRFSETRPPLPEVTDAHVQRYLDDGFLVLPDLLSADQVAALAGDAVALARGAYPSESLRPLPPHLCDDEVLSRLLCIHQPHAISPQVRGFVTHPGLVAALGRVAGAHLPAGWWDGGVKHMQSMLFIKPPGFPGQAWSITT